MRTLLFTLLLILASCSSREEEPDTPVGPPPIPTELKVKWEVTRYGRIEDDIDHGNWVNDKGYYVEFNQDNTVSAKTPYGYTAGMGSYSNGVITVPGSYSTTITISNSTQYPGFKKMTFVYYPKQPGNFDYYLIAKPK